MTQSTFPLRRCGKYAAMKLRNYGADEISFRSPSDNDTGIRTFVFSIDPIGNIRSASIILLYAYLLRKVARS